MKNDLQAIAAFFCAIGLIVLTTLLFCAASQWLAGAAYRMGLVSAPAQWTIYAMGLCICLGTIMTIACRLVTGDWWFHDYPLPRNER